MRWRRRTYVRATSGAWSRGSSPRPTCGRFFQPVYGFAQSHTLFTYSLDLHQGLPLSIVELAENVLALLALSEVTPVRVQTVRPACTRSAARACSAPRE